MSGKELIPIENLPNEIWKDIVGYEGIYEISNFGRLKSLPKKARSIGSAGYEYFIQRTEKIRRPSRDTFGYMHAFLHKDGNSKAFLIHRLVATAFIENPNNKYAVNHIDGIKQNNNVSNLEWVTKSENVKHAYSTGLMCNKGENHPGVKLNEVIVKEIRLKYIPRLYSSRKLAKEYGISKTQILDILNKKSWSHI